MNEPCSRFEGSFVWPVLKFKRKQRLMCLVQFKILKLSFFDEGCNLFSLFCKLDNIQLLQFLLWQNKSLHLDFTDFCMLVNPFTYLVLHMPVKLTISSTITLTYLYSLKGFWCSNLSIFSWTGDLFQCLYYSVVFYSSFYSGYCLVMEYQMLLGSWKFGNTLYYNSLSLV